MQEIKTETEYKKGDTIQDEESQKIYLVKSSRKMIESLGEPKGFLITIEEIKH